MDRGVVQMIEDDEEDKKPLLGSIVEHRNMEFGTSSSNIIPTFQSLQSTGSMAHNLLSTPAFGQATAHSSQEKSESSTSSTLQQPANHMQHLGSQSHGSQHGDKAQNPGLVKRPGGSAQAISFGTLMPMLLPILLPEKAQSLNALYTRLKKQEISKEDFLRATRLLVGDEILVNTVKNMQIKQLQGQMSRQQAAQTEMPHQLLFPQHSQHMLPQQQQQQTKSSLEQLQQQRQATLQVQQVGQQHQPQQLMQQMQSSLDVSMQYQANTRVPPMPLLPSEYRQEHRHQVAAASSSLSSQQVKHEVDKSQAAESSSGNVGASASIFSSLNAQPGNSAMAPLPSPLTIPDGGTVVASGSQVRTPPKKAMNDLKRPADVSPSLQIKSKKQKVAVDVLEQSIDQLNDVTAVSGVNLREEEEQLLAGPKEESRNTQVMRRFAQEEEGRLFLERGPLRTKVNGIAKHGVSVVTEEAEQCLSMSVEERFRNMLYKLSKISGRRCDQEKEMHKLVVTSDIQKQILLIRKQAKEAQEEKQALESERLRKLNEEKEKSSQNEGATKEDGTTSRSKEKKSQKGDEGKQKGNAASLAARSANDMLLKWQMMAEQGRQKREGESGATTANDTTVIPSIGAANASSSEIDKKHLETRQTGRAAPTDGGIATAQSAKVSGDMGQMQGLSQQGSLLNQPTKPPHTITVKDIVAYLETESQMTESSLIYRLHNKSSALSQVA